MNHRSSTSMREELQKLGGAGGTLAKFWDGAKHEAGPALGAIGGAGLAKVVGIDPLAGAAAGYGLGATGDIVKALKERKALKTMNTHGPGI